MRERRTSGLFVVVGILGTIGLHLAVAGALWLARGQADAAKPMGPGMFVDAQLVKFGRPRDLKFLPHKQGSVKSTKPPEALKVARDLNDLPRLDKDKDDREVDPLKKTHADLFKKMLDDDRPPAVVEDGVGSLTGSRAGTAEEAKGDPYILALIDRIGSAWTVPTTIKENELAGLTAEYCLTIAEDGTLTGYRQLRASANGLFNSSLEAALATVKKTKLPPPPDRFRAAAARGRLCPTFSKH
jgi:hypothetical protein